MYSIVARRSQAFSDRTQRPAPDLAFRVAFLHAHAETVPLIQVIPQRGVAARGVPALANDSRNTIELARVRSAWDRYSDALSREHVEKQLDQSLVGDLAGHAEPAVSAAASGICRVEW